MDRPAALVLRELGGDPDGHVARQLTPELVAAADLVLTATTEQRDWVTAADPAADGRTFTMREFARLGAGCPSVAEVNVDVSDAQVSADALRARVREIAARRDLGDPGAPGQDEIGDPFGAPIADVRATGALISASVDATIAALGLWRRT